MLRGRMLHWHVMRILSILCHVWHTLGKGKGMGKDQKPPEWGRCTYCGRHVKLTTDHIIPRCLFNGSIPDDVPKVRVCQECNVLKGSDDTFLRDVLVRDVRQATHPIAQDIRYGAFARSLSKAKSQYPRDASRLRVVPSPADSGLLIYEPVLPKERMRKIFIRLVRGLMVAYERYELSSTTNFDVLRAVDTKVALDEAQRWGKDTSGMTHIVQVGNGSVFSCIYYHSLTEGHFDVSKWWLRFYENSIYWIGTGMSNLSIGEF